MSAVCRILWDGPADPAADSSTATLEKEAHDEDAMRSKIKTGYLGYCAPLIRRGDLLFACVLFLWFVPV